MSAYTETLTASPFSITAPCPISHHMNTTQEGGGVLAGLKIIRVHRKGCEKCVINCPSSIDELEVVLKETLQMISIDKITIEASGETVTSLEGIPNNATLFVEGVNAVEICSPKVGAASTNSLRGSDGSYVFSTDPDIASLNVGNVAVADADESLTDATNVWCHIPASIFDVRGPDYFETAAKVPSKDELAVCVGFSRWQTPEPIENVKDSEEGRLAIERIRAVRPEGKIIIVSIKNAYVGGWVSSYYIQIISFFLVKDDIDAINPVTARLVEELFTTDDDEFRNSRIKLIPCIVDGNWLVRQAVGTSKPVIIGRKLTNTYDVEENLIEIGIDVNSSIVARQITGISLTYAASLIVDLAFVLEVLLLILHRYLLLASFLHSSN
jgi:hypothetical protein